MMPTTSGCAQLSLEVENAVFVGVSPKIDVCFLMFLEFLLFHVLPYSVRKVWLATSQPSPTPERSSEIRQQKAMTDYLGHFGRLFTSKQPHSSKQNLSEREITHPQNVAETWFFYRLDCTQKHILAGSFVA